MPCMIVGRLFDMGYFHSIFIAASAMLVVATLLVGQCTQYWQFLICQGITTGLACGIIVGPLTAILAQWFKDKRALALGFSAAGSSLGGTLLPVIARSLLPHIGFSWTMRVFALIELVTLSFANIIIRRRLPPTYPQGPLIGIKPLKSLQFVAYCLATLLVYVGLYTFMTYIAATAVSKGIPESASYNLVAIMNGSSGVGRIAAGVIATYIGPINHMIPSTFIAGIVILCWPTVETQPAFIAIAIVFGFSAGSYAALLWQPIIDLGDKDELSRRVGLLMLFLACAGLFGPPTSGEVNKAAGIRAMGIYAGLFDAPTVHREYHGEKELDEKDVEQPKSSDVDDYPDGGARAWLIVLGTSLAGFGTFGFVNSWGVFQSYYEETLLKGTSPSTIAWIGSIQYSLIFLPGLITGRLFDVGIFKVPFAIASAGFALGIASGTVFGPSMGVIGHWFKRRRGLALGVTATGSSVGGTVLPIAARRLIVQVGFPWTMRIIGFILLLVLFVPNLTLARRLPPVHITGGLLNLKAFKSPAFSIYSLAIWVSFLGLYTVLTYIDISAINFGISPDFSFYLVSITNAASGFGRLSSAIMTDRLGPINYYAPMTIVAAVLTYAWPFARNIGSLVAVAIIYGFSSGAFVSSFLMPVYEMGEIGDVGRRTGMVMTIAAVGALIGPPISGAINHSSGGFETVGYYAGTMILFSAGLMVVTKYLVLRSLRGKF
ncbi:hypothetical protein VNI00_010296 [Paramarasmius palmivorus]|uniref:Major facilitator superfamily (MFS) profile domain-containing protein n=1 Tax=Paramarasmius palmivorus TaxID=297713 RepID=A0AAW0CJQ2_9AGAR